jgi:hypothetical protein
VSDEAAGARRAVVSVPEMFAHRVRFDGDASFVLTPDGRARTAEEIGEHLASRSDQGKGAP